MRQAFERCVLVVDETASRSAGASSLTAEGERTVVLHPGRSSRVAADLVREGTKVVVARVPRGFGDLLRVIDLVRCSGERVSVVAVCEEHDDRVEAALRAAGVSAYFASGEGEGTDETDGLMKGLGCGLRRAV
jgi:hypothetical protein